MGCCISKCKNPQLQQSHNQFFNDHNNVQDKLVISQPRHPSPITINPRPINYPNYKISRPNSPTSISSTSSASSFTCTTTTTSTTASSKLDRSFSNDFLFSLYKDNPHITRINSIKHAATTKPLPNNTINPSPPRTGLSTILKPHSPLQNVATRPFPVVPQKRIRSNSPTNLTRQKSFRKELQPPERQSAIRTIRSSPSPSRRFGNGNGSSQFDHSNSFSKQRTSNHNNNHFSPKVSAIRNSRSVSSNSARKQSSVKAAAAAAASPNNINGLRRRETCTYRIGSKIDESVVRDVVAKDDEMENLDLMEVDIDNPLISLDCFIFL